MEAANGRRIPFSVIATTTPKLLVDAGSRQCVVIYNASGQNIFLGASGTLATLGLVLPTSTQFHDLFSGDEWWVSTASSSGTVSGYTVA